MGVHFDNKLGVVTVPACFQQPYRAISEAGFIGVSADPAFGGLGLPLSVSVACKEYFLRRQRLPDVLHAVERQCRAARFILSEAKRQKPFLSAENAFPENGAARCA